MHHNRKHRAGRLLAIAATAAALLFVLSILVRAQAVTAPTDEELASGLTRAGGLFHATAGDTPPTLGNLQHGRDIAQSGGKGAASAACASCHGARGEGNDGLGAPRLAGLPAWYLLKQMRDYAAGARKSEIMQPIAAALPDNEASDLASYYAVLAAPVLAPSATDDGKSYGARLASVGNADKAIPACVNCHGPLGTGLTPSVPYLAGQHAGYLEHQLRDWLAGSRANDENGVDARGRAENDG